jgi:hypothetical protein
MRRGDLTGILLLLLSVAALEAFRLLWFEPRAIAIACLHHAAAPALCATRAGMGWLVNNAILGTLALAFGIAAIATQNRSIAIAAACLGAAGLINYNVSWGMLGACLGLWAWLLAPINDEIT